MTGKERERKINAREREREREKKDIIRNEIRRSHIVKLGCFRSFWTNQN